MQAPDPAMIREFAVSTALPACAATAFAAATALAGRYLPGGALWTALGVPLAFAVGFLVYALAGPDRNLTPGIPPANLLAWPAVLAPATGLLLGLLLIARPWPLRLAISLILAIGIIVADLVLLRHLPGNAALATGAFLGLALPWAIAHLIAIKGVAMAGAGAGAPGWPAHLAALAVAGTATAIAGLGGAILGGKIGVLALAAACGALVGAHRAPAPVGAAVLAGVLLICGQNLLAHRILNDPPLPITVLALWAAAPFGLLVLRRRAPVWLGLGITALFCAAALAAMVIWGQPEPSGY
jgi:hypothetical protein